MSDRKARLAALAARAGRTKKSTDGDAADASTKAIRETENGDPSLENDHVVTNQEGSFPSSKKKEITFRNYSSSNAHLQSQRKEQDKGDDQPSSKRLRSEEKEAETAATTTKSALQLALEKAKAQVQGGDIHTAQMSSSNNNDVADAMAAQAAPKKVNWDLKRDIQPKLDKLNRRTQKVLVQLLQERLSELADDEDT